MVRFQNTAWSLKHRLWCVSWEWTLHLMHTSKKFWTKVSWQHSKESCQCPPGCREASRQKTGNRRSPTTSPGDPATLGRTLLQNIIIPRKHIKAHTMGRILLCRQGTLHRKLNEILKKKSCKSHLGFHLVLQELSTCLHSQMAKPV